jgi:hypothetical protein
VTSRAGQVGLETAQKKHEINAGGAKKVLAVAFPSTGHHLYASAVETARGHRIFAACGASAGSVVAGGTAAGGHGGVGGRDGGVVGGHRRVVRGGVLGGSDCAAAGAIGSTELRARTGKGEW